MTPIQQAKATYEPGDTNTFEGDLVWHLHNAYVWSGDDAFVMGRPMPKEKVAEECTHKTTYPIEDCDTWFVWLGSGNGHKNHGHKSALKRFLEVAPFKLEYVAWHRRGAKLKIYKWKTYERKVDKYGNKS